MASAETTSLEFLARAGEALASSLDYEATLQQVAQLAIPILGDICIVDMVEGQELRRVATAHVDPEKVALLDELRRRYPAAPGSPSPAGQVLRSGKPDLLVDVNPEVIASRTADAAHAAIIKQIGMRSHIAVPLIARGTTLGVISVALVRGPRRYTEADLALAIDLARRAALAIDNALLYHAAQQQLAERTLADSRFRATTEQSPLSIQILASDGSVALVNKAWERLWGVTLADIPGYNLLEDPQLEARGVAALLRRAFAGEVVELPVHRYNPNETLENKSRHTDPVKYVRTFAYPIKTATGNVHEVALIQEDVTERVRAEEKLRASEERTRILADAGDSLGGSLDLHVTLDSLSRVLVPRLADWCAIDLLDVAGNLEQFSVYHTDPARVAAALEHFNARPPRQDAPHGPWRVLSTGQPELIPVVTDDGDHRLARVKSIISVPIAARNKTIGLLTLAQAESSRVFTDDDLTLAIDLAHRTASAVENAHLYQRLRDEDRRKDEFLATLAHELRNPLAPISTGLELLQMAADPKLERTRVVMDRQLKNLVRLVDDLLDVSRVTRGKIDLRPEPIDVASIVATALEVSRPLIERGGLELTVTLPPEPLTFLGDRTRVAQILSNLLNNAAKYNEPGGKITVTVQRDADEVVFDIRDTGIGIPREMQSQIFEMFVQVQRSYEQRHGGLGIGLTLVRRLVDLHGGSVWAESEGLGKGSTFIVRLPHVIDAMPNQPAQQQSTERKPRRVLLVDDNTDAIETLSALLALDGHEVRTATSGPDALALVREFRPDIALLDIGLPGMNGYELARQLRTDPMLQHITLVAITGWGQAEDRRQSQEAGFHHHFTKPVDPRELHALFESR